ncbi:hypothetical protein FHX16_006162 [Rhizobium sp. BK661]|nr:hypothetical protein [Rhizobium sp. BK661]
MNRRNCAAGKSSGAKAFFVRLSAFLTPFEWSRLLSLNDLNGIANFARIAELGGMMSEYGVEPD